MSPPGVILIYMILEDYLSRESTCLTSRGSAVRARHPPSHKAGLAQLVEQLTCIQQVGCSSPLAGTIIEEPLAESVEHLTFNQKVVGSIPASLIINSAGD